MSTNPIKQWHPALLALAVFTSAPASGNTLVYDDVGGWTIRTDLDQDYRCFAEALYEDGSVVRAGFNSPDASFYISVSDSSWSGIEDGRLYQVRVNFDEGPARNFAAIGVSVDTAQAQAGLRLEIPEVERDRLMSSFMQRQYLSVEHGSRAPTTLSLAGSRAAVSILQDCHAVMSAAYAQAGGASRELVSD